MTGDGTLVARSNAREPRRALIAAFALAVLGVGTAMLGGPALAARLSVVSELDRDEIAVGETAVLTVTVTAEGLSAPRVGLPPIEGVQVDRLGESQGLTWINGRVSRTLAAAFRLRGMREGDVRIPAIRVVSSSVSAETMPLTLRVRRTPRVAREGGADLFVRLALDRRRAYWNEGILARYTLYSRARLEGAPVWDPPDAAGFWSEILGPARTGRAVLQGVEYDVAELRVAYFPTRTGRLGVGPGRVHVRVVRQIQPVDPWGGLTGFPERQVEEVTLQTERMEVDVRPLPPGAPPSFRGAVGSYTLAVRVDRATVRAGEPVTVTSSIRGEGNVASVGDPEIVARGAARRYARAGGTILDRAGDRPRGERRREVTLVPDAPGELAVLPVRFSWFDPEGARYRTQGTDTIRVRVLPAERLGDSLTQTPLPGPIASLRTRRGPIGPLTLDPPAGAGALALGSLLAYAGSLVGVRLRERLERDPRRRRERALNAVLDALRDPRRAEAHAGGEAARLAALLRRAAGTRFEVDLQGGTLTDALATLAAAGAPEPWLADLRDLLDRLDRIAFAPGAGSGSDLAAAREQAVALVRRLREEPR